MKQVMAQSASLLSEDNPVIINSDENSDENSENGGRNSLPTFKNLKSHPTIE